MRAKDNQDPKNFTEFMDLTEKPAEFAIFVSSVMNAGFNPAPLVSLSTALMLFSQALFY